MGEGLEIQVDLTVAAGPEAGKSFRLSQRRSVIGRRKGDIVIRDVEISGSHAAIEVEDGGRVVVLDLDSTNGTFVNGKRVEKAALRSDDRLTLGQSKVVVKIVNPKSKKSKGASAVDEGSADRWEGSFDLDGIGALIQSELDGFKENTDSAVLDIARAEEELKLPFRTNLFLEFLDGPQKGTRFQFTKGNIVVGRLNSDLVVKDSDVSRRHALIEAYTREKIFIKDLASTNGTFVNEKRVTYDKIANGDNVRVGRTLMKFLVEELG